MMTVQQMKIRFGLHPHPDPKEDGVTLPAPPPPPQGLRGQPLPGSDGPIPVPPGGLEIDPSLFDMPDLRV
jgi:hypothetical protein